MTFTRTALGQIDASLVQVGLLVVVLGCDLADGFVFISDSLLGILVDPMAFLLAGFTVVLFLAVMLSRRTSNR